MIFRKIILKTIALLLLLLSFYSCHKKESVVLKDSTYNTKQVNQYYKLANDYYDNSKYDSAFYYANKTKLIINPEKEIEKYTITMFILITSQQLQGDYSGAESAIVETLSFVDKSNSDRYKWKFYGMLASNYSYLHNYDEAIYYHKKALSFNVSKIKKLSDILNIAYAYSKKEDYKKALEIYEPILKGQEIKKNKYYYSNLLNNIGYCYFKMGNPNAITYLNKSLEMNSNMDSTADDDYSLTSNYLYLYKYYMVHDKAKAIKYANLFYQKGKEYNNPDDCLLALSFLIKNSSGKELKKYSLNYIHLSDSITKVKEKSKNYFAKLKYDSKKEKEENLKLKAEKELQQELEKSKNIVIIFTIVMIVFVSGFAYYYLIEKNKKEKLQTAYNTEIRISKKLHDELANDIFQTINFAETNDLSSDDNTEKLLVNLDHIYSTTRNISRENSLIETGNLFEENLKEMIYSFKNHTVNIMINGLENMDWSTINNFKKVTIYRVIQELLINMKKHSKSNLVIVSFKKQENDLILNYFDNGIGMNLEENIKKNGLQNAENRITAINGSFTLDSKLDHGIKINMIIPI